MTETPPTAPEPPRAIIDLGPIQGIISAVRDRIENVWTSLTDLAQQFSDALRSMIEGLLPSALQALAGAVTAFSTLTSGLLENLTSTPDLWQSMLDTFGTDLTKRVPHLTGEKAGDVVGHALNKDHSPVDPQQIHDAWQDMFPPARAVLNIAALLAGVMGYLQAASAGGIEGYRQASMLDAQPTALSPAELAQATVQNVIGKEFAESHAKRSGLTPELFDILVTSYGDPVGWQAALELWRRGTFTEADVEQAIRESRVKNKYVDAIKSLRFVLPSPGDLIRFMVRDVFDDAVVTDLTLDAEFDQKYNGPLFDQVGLDRDLARSFWRSHWQLPAIGQLFEMHQRTTDAPTAHSEAVTLSNGQTVHRLLNLEMLQRLLGVNDVLPVFREKLTEIAFNPLTRVDVRRMHQLGVLDQAGVERAYLDIGYSQSNAQRLAAFSQSLVDKGVETARVKAAKPMTDRILASYQDAVLSRGDAAQLLTDLGTPSDQVEAELAVADVRRAQVRADQVRKGIESLFRDQFIDEPTARQRLADAGIGDAEADHLLASWSVELEYKVDRQTRSHLKDLSRADILEAFRDHLLGREDATASLEGVGYDAFEAEALLSIEDARLARSLQKDKVAAIQAQYTAGRIEWDSAQQQLFQIGENPDRIEWLHQRWDVERDKRTPDVPLATLEYLVREQLTDESEVRTELLRRGYTEREADWLLAAWRQRVAVSQQQLELQRQRLAQQAQQFDVRTQQQRQLSDARLQAQLEIASRRLEQSASSQSARLQQQAASQEKAIAARQELAARAQQTQQTLQQQRLDVQQKLAGETNAIARDRLQQQVTLLDRRIQAQQTAAQQHQQDQVQLVNLRDQLAQASAQRAATAQLARDQRTQAFQLQKLGVQQTFTAQRDVTREQAQARQTARQLGAQVTLRAVDASQKAALAAAQSAALATWQQQIAGLVQQMVAELVTRIQPPAATA